MRNILIILSFILCSCQVQNKKNNEQISNTSSDSLFIKKGYIKYHSKYHYTFFYSKSWIKLSDIFFKNAVQNSYAKPDPSIDTEVGFTLDNEYKDYIFPRFHIEVELDYKPSLADLKKQMKDYLDSQYMDKNKNDNYSSFLVDNLSILSYNKPTIDENNKIIFQTTILNLKDQGDLYTLSVTFLGRENLVSMKIFLPYKDKNKYLKDISKMISSFHFDKGFEYK